MKFKHSGDYGDIIYSLPTVRALGGGEMLIATSGRTRQRQSEASVAVIAPLLLAQEYIHGVRLLRGESADTDLDVFRKYWDTHPVYAKPIAAYIAECFCFKPSIVEEPWLSALPDYKSPIVINRSQRYKNISFPWKEIVGQYADQILFVGLPVEWQEFTVEFGKVEFYATQDFLQVAQIIAGSKVFIGNQSCCYAIAEGLKHNTIQETWLTDPNCIFWRSNADFIASDRMPDIEQFL